MQTGVNIHRLANDRNSPGSCVGAAFALAPRKICQLMG